VPLGLGEALLDGEALGEGERLGEDEGEALGDGETLGDDVSDGLGVGLPEPPCNCTTTIEYAGTVWLFALPAVVDVIEEAFFRYRITVGAPVGAVYPL